MEVTTRLFLGKAIGFAGLFGSLLAILILYTMGFNTSKGLLGVMRLRDTWWTLMSAMVVFFFSSYLVTLLAGKIMGFEDCLDKMHHLGGAKGFFWFFPLGALWYFVCWGLPTGSLNWIIWCVLLVFYLFLGAFISKQFSETTGPNAWGVSSRSSFFGLFL